MGADAIPSWATGPELDAAVARAAPTEVVLATRIGARDPHVVIRRVAAGALGLPAALICEAPNRLFGPPLQPANDPGRTSCASAGDKETKNARKSATDNFGVRGATSRGVGIMD